MRRDLYWACLIFFLHKYTSISTFLTFEITFYRKLLKKRVSMDRKSFFFAVQNYLFNIVDWFTHGGSLEPMVICWLLGLVRSFVRLFVHLFTYLKCKRDKRRKKMQTTNVSAGRRYTRNCKKKRNQIERHSYFCTRHRHRHFQYMCSHRLRISSKTIWSNKCFLTIGNC